MLVAPQAEAATGASRATAQRNLDVLVARSLVREVTGQGPEKTLARGFAIVRTLEGKPVTDQAQARALPALEFQFRDGVVPARPDDRNRKE